MIVMVVAGLWHGAALGFLVWGFLHGLFLIIDKSVNKKKSGNRIVVFATKSLGWVGTQIFVFFAWIFFRNPNLADAVTVIGSILNRSIGTFEISDALLVLFALAITISLDLVEALFSPKIKLLNPLLKGLMFGILFVIILTMRSSSVVPFIYFRF
jgi:alginate O-acetyltransferase complex protein AlgI